MDNQILTTDPKDIAISVRKRIARHRDIQKRNIIRLKRSIKAVSVIELEDGLIAALKNISSSIPLTAKEMTVRTQRTLIKSLKPLLQTSDLSST